MPSLAFWNGPGRPPRARNGVAPGDPRSPAWSAWQPGYFTGLPIIGLLVAVAVPGAPWLFNVGKAEHDAIARIEAVGEWARRLKDVSVIGMGLQQAIVASAGTAPADIADEVRDLAVRLQAGVDARDRADAVRRRHRRRGLRPGRRGADAAPVDRGDRLGEVLTSIAGAASAEVATRREVDAKRTQSRFAVKFLTIATLLPSATASIRPSYMQPYGRRSASSSWSCSRCCSSAILLWVRR